MEYLASQRNKQLHSNWSNYGHFRAPFAELKFQNLAFNYIANVFVIDCYMKNNFSFSKFLYHNENTVKNRQIFKYQESSNTKIKNRQIFVSYF